LIACLLLPAFLAVSLVYLGPGGILVALLCSGLTVWFLRFRLRRAASARLVAA
jgi:hypothetical protein